MANEFRGFRFSGTLYGGKDATARIVQYPASAAGVLTKGDTVSLARSGRVALGATDASTFVGVVAATKNYAVAEMVPVIVNHDAVWEVYDPNARIKGATLDVSGATGAQTVAASSNADLINVESTSADELSRVMFSRAETVLGF